MIQTSFIQDYIVVDLVALAIQMAADEFHERYECQFTWNELYEQVDETGAWYLRDEYALILTGMEQEWRMKIMSYGKETLHSIINLN